MNRELMDRMVGAVRKAQKLLDDSPRVARALEPALNVCYFLSLGHGYDFEHYLAAFQDPALPVYGAFECDDDYLAWMLSELEDGRVPRGLVEVAGTRFMIGYSRALGDALLFRIPAAEDLRRPFVEQEREQLWDALDRAEGALSNARDEEAVEGLHWAALGLHFVCEAGCASEYAWFSEHIEDGLRPLRVFETLEEAEDWLWNHPSPPNGAPIQVGSEELTVGYWPGAGVRALLHALTLPVTAVKEEEEEDEGGDGGLVH